MNCMINDDRMNICDVLGKEDDFDQTNFFSVMNGNVDCVMNLSIDGFSDAKKNSTG